MARLNVPPTKSNLQRLKYDLHFAREGYDMLEQKRQILVLELVGLVEAAKRAQSEVQEKMAAAYAALREAMLRNGTFLTERQAAAPQPAHSTGVATRSLMGIYLSSLSPDHPPFQPAGSLLSGNPALDDVARAFRAALESIDRLAEIENAVFRLAREVRKTQRRVNALDRIFIPSYEQTVNFIAGVLEERERDEFVIMRMLRERMDKARSHLGSPPG